MNPPKKNKYNWRKVGIKALRASMLALFLGDVSAATAQNLDGTNGNDTIHSTYTNAVLSGAGMVRACGGTHPA